MRYGTVDSSYLTRLATCEPSDDGPILMVNLMRYREQADYTAAPHAAPAEPVSGREADDRYAPLDVLESIGAEIAFVGDVIETAGDRWDRVAIVRYPSRRAFIEMQSRADFQEKHVHKDAGMEFTIVLGTVPAPGAMAAGRRRGSLVRFDLLPEATRTAETTDAGDDVLLLDVEGVIVGDERRWSALAVSHVTSAEPDTSGDATTSVVVLPTIDVLDHVVHGWHDD